MPGIYYRSVGDRPTTGGGGRGTLPPEPFGGGGGGGRGDGDHDETPSYRERLRRYRMGLFVTSGSILMLFISFTTLLLARRYAGRFDPFSGEFVTQWVPLQLPVKLLAMNTAILLISSLTAEAARRAASKEAILVPITRIPGVAPIPQRASVWIAITSLLGFGFLAGQLAAWRVLRVAGEFPDANNLASSFVYLLTGAHALHLFGGLVVLLYALVAPKPRRSLESRRLAVDVTAFYWHFMGAMWLYVLVVLYALQ
ncbi:MAG TPA: cytochrome c oxidase subunit 3 [Clostridia bacterium]|nr:cytochrome c oxidase subunit 3 [Clostridia bacterium]